MRQEIQTHLLHPVRRCIRHPENHRQGESGSQQQGLQRALAIDAANQQKVEPDQPGIVRLDQDNYLREYRTPCGKRRSCRKHDTAITQRLIAIPAALPTSMRRANGQEKTADEPPGDNRSAR